MIRSSSSSSTTTTTAAAMERPTCDLYTAGPTLRFANELRELTGAGLDSTAPLDHRSLAAIDSMHYLGHEGTDAMLRAVGPRNARRVLDFGSGFGGCSRYVAGQLLLSAPPFEELVGGGEEARKGIPCGMP